MLKRSIVKLKVFAFLWIAFIIILEKHNENNQIEAIFDNLHDTSTLSSSNAIVNLQQSHDFLQYTNPKIQKQGCSLTVLVSDPRITSEYNHEEFKLWYALESVAVNVVPIETTCILLQTSRGNCQQQQQQQQQQYSLDKTENDIYNQILQMALPQFRALMQRGNVRLSFLNIKEQYPLTSSEHCNKWNINRLYMHPQFWKNEFLPLDSDFVLVIQPDAVLCHTLEINRWNDLAFVGSVWSPKEKLYGKMKAYWQKWNNNPNINTDQFRHFIPSGNGGLSLRSRKWMQRAIETCPFFLSDQDQQFLQQRQEQQQRSKHNNSKHSKHHCFVSLDVAEDVYFATVLRGLLSTQDAPLLPNAIESALFATETLFLNDLIPSYPNIPKNILGVTQEQQINHIFEETVRKRWGPKLLLNYKRMKNEPSANHLVVPIGLHKPWPYHNYDVLMSNVMQHECPYLEKISSHDWVHNGRNYLEQKKRQGF